MAEITLSIALADYDHVRDLVDGRVKPEGISLVPLRLPVEEIFYRFTRFREWDVSEMSFAKYVALASQPDCDLVAIPVFPSRAFRHSSIYVRSDGPVRQASDLRGARVGVPEWAQTAAIYTRGLISDDWHIDLASIEWTQAGVNEAGRVEKVALRLPEGIRVRARPDSTLSKLLVDGELDAVLSARPPAPFTGGDGRVRRLFDDVRDVERAYWEARRVFPIMHVVAIRRALVDRHPWIAGNLVKAFAEARNRSVARLSDVTQSAVPLPWISQEASIARQMFGDDPWPYGIEANRPTLETFLRYAAEQGVAHRTITPEQLFPATVQSAVKV